MIVAMADRDSPDFFDSDDVQRYMEELEGIERLDLLALKAQVLIEYRLRHLLAIRMRAAPSAIFRATQLTPAAALIALAVCDDSLDWMRKDLLKLNNARVAVAHGLGLDDHHKHLAQFIRAKRGKNASVDVKNLRKAMWRALSELELLESDLSKGVLESSGSRLARYAERRSRNYLPSGRQVSLNEGA
jgi:hypothetical protein